ncbi:MAG TPA: GNAT family N-acetyltransferase [Acetobacteraceae bacterium]|nr:GNAT family N-acetyltransferase [Acetobacteraceae bacterium]
MTWQTGALRLATSADIGAVARLHREVRRACLPYLPDLHTAEEDERFFRQHVFPSCTVWIAEIDRIIGFCAFRPGWVDHLYVAPDFHGRGIGSALLAKAMAVHSHLQLWVFTRNAPAIRFYIARGFRRVTQTDGSRNEEREPDALYEWRRRAV